jgi:hypothetical protein
MLPIAMTFAQFALPVSRRQPTTTALRCSMAHMHSPPTAASDAIARTARECAFL